MIDTESGASLSYLSRLGSLTAFFSVMSLNKSSTMLKLLFFKAISIASSSLLLPPLILTKLFWLLAKLLFYYNLLFSNESSSMSRYSLPEKSSSEDESISGSKPSLFYWLKNESSAD